MRSRRRSSKCHGPINQRKTGIFEVLYNLWIVYYHEHNLNDLLFPEWYTDFDWVNGYEDHTNIDYKVTDHGPK
jgi:succinate dehydrogenase hydrophobic anchor subunit